MGHLACNVEGIGKLPAESVLVDAIVKKLKEVPATQDYSGKKVLVTAGPTRESIDHVRYMTNQST